MQQLGKTIEIRKSKQRGRSTRTAWVLLPIVLLIALAGWYWILRPGKSAAQAASGTTYGVSMQTVAVRRGDLRVIVSGSGTLAAAQSVDLSFPTSGTVVELNVMAGDFVTTGQSLARLGGAEDLQAALAALKVQQIEAQQTLTTLQANADLNLAQSYQTLLSTQAAYEDAVKANARTSGTRCSREVTMRNAATLERTQSRLAELDGVDHTANLWITANADYQTAQANYTYCAAYTDDEKKQVAAAETLALAKYEKAQTSYTDLSTTSGVDASALSLAEATLEKLDAQITEAQSNLDGIVLIAPMDGRVIYLAAGKGQMVNTATYLTIAAVDQPVIEISMDENDVAQLVLGSAAVVTFDALLDQTFNGTLTQIDPSLTASGQYRLVKGTVTLDDAAASVLKTLPIGMNAGVEIVTQQATNVLLVPVTALKKLESGKYAVMAIGQDGEPIQQEVATGIQDAASAEIRSGLEEGTLVSAIVTQDQSTTTKNNTDVNNIFPPDGGGNMPPP